MAPMAYGKLAFSTTIVLGLALTIWFTKSNCCLGRSISLRSMPSLPSDGRQLEPPKPPPHVGLLPTKTIATSESAAMLRAIPLLLLSRTQRTCTAGPTLARMPSMGVTA